MKKSNKIVAVLLALVMIITAVPMMTVSADVAGGGWGDILPLPGKDEEDKHEHVYIIQSEVEGSCTEPAKTTFKCSCGDVKVMTTGEPAHKPAANGYFEKDKDLHSNYCTVCKKLFDEPHKEFEYVVYEDCVAPTCEKEGKLVYQCSKCNAKRTEVLEPSVHIPSGKVVNDANKHGFTCVACEKLIDEEHVWDDGVLDENIRCGDNGKITYTCLVVGCNKTKEVTVPSNCLYADKEDIENGLEPKIQLKDADGVDNYDEDNHTFECKYCSKDKTEPHEYVVQYTYRTEVNSVRTMSMRNAGDAETTEPVSEEPTEAPSEEPTEETCNHVWNDWLISTEPTCESTGVKTTYCEECGDVKTEDIPVVDCSYEWIMIQFPTEEEPGVEVLKCTMCGEVVEENIITFVKNTPTCQQEGEILVTCKYCEYYYYATVDTIDHEIVEDAKYTKFSKDHHFTQCVYCGEVKMPHTWGEWKVETPATAEKEGKKVRVCADCGQEEVETISKLTGKLGDVNGDGSVTAVDARIILQHVAELRTLTAKEQEAADMNGDGNVTAVDARMILQIVAAGE